MRDEIYLFKYFVMIFIVVVLSMVSSYIILNLECGKNIYTKTWDT
ncbi:Uncharacterised protein [uncultured Bacteroides sp.]|nr:Uncharacterised protein [uncultured Bacteroides sp.]